LSLLHRPLPPDRLRRRVTVNCPVEGLGLRCLRLMPVKAKAIKEA